MSDIKEIVDKLGINQFVVCGFSIGTSWAQQIAVAMPERVRGIILFGTMADTGHPDCPKALASKIGKPPKIMDPNGGCLGFILRGAFSGPCKAYQKCAVQHLPATRPARREALHHVSGDPRSLG